ncbi:hypothetical protein [Marinimicrobium sp. ABcell2]|uniref:hypothetical protein n=1 Tax=Marinimicrobium sp. ABcell2 TaxID=3069751 RepID=UPI0027B26BAF|nr:hypothetical protein [Marinimicrobium sp. ABcell2]MDQ2075982.1 hypothetical protein [Marinimicrobium sp. ABcell2]
MIATQHQPLQKREPQGTEPSSAKDLYLVEVPPPIFLGHPASQRRGVWRGVFDIAVWLRTPTGVQEPLQLILKYWDDSGVQQLALDRCHIGGHRTVLLNASFLLRVTGQVRRAGLYIKSIGRRPAVYLEEWHLIPQDRSVRRMK